MPLAASISDSTIWSVTFDDTRSVDYDRNSFIIQATDDNSNCNNKMVFPMKTSKIFMGLSVFSKNHFFSFCITFVFAFTNQISSHFF
jgi:hypothetical protein